MKNLRWTVGLLLALGLAGCGGNNGNDSGTPDVVAEGGGSDGGGGGDATPGMDVVPGSDVVTPGDGGADVTSPGDSGVTVASCQAAVDAVRAACVAEDPSSGRLCIYDAMRPLCASGRTAFVQALANCLLMDACQSPSDPSNATACVQSLIAAQATAADRALGMEICRCEAGSPEPNCGTNLPSYSLANTMMLNESGVTSLTMCATSMGCDQQLACAMASTLGPLYECP